jgi:hypothetical protein
MLAALVALLCSAGSQAQTPGKEWAHVPPPPTACYYTQDNYERKYDAAHAKVVAELEPLRAAQAQATEEAQANVTDVDPWKLMERMNQAMLDDPAKAAETMQAYSPEAVQESGAQYQEVQQQKQALLDELKRLRERHAALVGTARGPSSYYEPGGEGVPTSVIDAQVAKFNAAYRGTLCPQWFGPTGHYTAWLKRFKDHLVQKQIPAEQEREAMNQRGRGQMLYEGAAPPSIAPLEAVREYIEQANAIYGYRELGPMQRVYFSIVARDLQGQPP